MEPIYYMRSNHTFLEIPSNLDEAMRKLRHEVMVNGQTHGMLCTKRPGVEHLHCHGYDSTTKFFGQAWDWLKARKEEERAV